MKYKVGLKLYFILHPLYSSLITENLIVHRSSLKNLLLIVHHSSLLSHHSIEIPQLHRRRTVRILLPKAYFKYPDRRFPVMYLQDGQNLFERKTAFMKDWGLSRLMDALPLKHQYIMVGIDHGGVDRRTEYMPGPKGSADAYLRFIAETLKPSIDREFRTRPDIENTMIAGSSLGGLLALYAATRYSHIFGKAGVLSPSVWAFPSIYKIKPDQYKSKIYVAGSNNESRYMGEQLKKIYWSLREAGYPEDRFRVVIRDRGRHNESFWGREFKALTKWLVQE